MESVGFLVLSGLVVPNAGNPSNKRGHALLAEQRTMRNGLRHVCSNRLPRAPRVGKLFVYETSYVGRQVWQKRQIRLGEIELHGRGNQQNCMCLWAQR